MTGKLIFIFKIILLIRTFSHATSNRGVLGFIIGVNICSGTLVTFVLSHFFSYEIMPSVGFALTIVFLVLIQWFPDTPQSLVRRRHMVQAELSLRFYKQLDDTKLAAAEMQRLIDEYSTCGNNNGGDRVTLAELCKN